MFYYSKISNIKIIVTEGFFLPCQTLLQDGMKLWKSFSGWNYLLFNLFWKLYKTKIYFLTSAF